MHCVSNTFSENCLAHLILYTNTVHFNFKNERP